MLLCYYNIYLLREAQINFCYFLFYSFKSFNWIAKKFNVLVSVRKGIKHINWVHIELLLKHRYFCCVFIFLIRENWVYNNGMWGEILFLYSVYLAIGWTLDIDSFPGIINRQIDDHTFLGDIFHQLKMFGTPDFLALTRVQKHRFFVYSQYRSDSLKLVLNCKMAQTSFQIPKACVVYSG